MIDKLGKDLLKNKAGADQSKPATPKTKQLNVITNRLQPIVSNSFIDQLKMTFRLIMVGVIVYLVHLWGIKL